MELMETMKILAKLLLHSGVSKNNAIAVSAMLKDSEEKMQHLFLWIYDNHPTEEEIMRKAIAMSKEK
ncbi:MAG: hypothetical protein IKV17_00695 [Bacteroidaceae bacterium]|nr:hypothetical protein [Bacteroidaceae bacterium]